MLANRNIIATVLVFCVFGQLTLCLPSQLQDTIDQVAKRIQKINLELQLRSDATEKYSSNDETIQKIEDSLRVLSKQQLNQSHELQRNRDSLEILNYALESLNEKINRIQNITVEEEKSYEASTISPNCTLKGYELAPLLINGTRVVRGKDWEWDDQDGNTPGEGTVTGPVSLSGWVRVKWNHGTTNNYRMGNLGKYDLKLAECRWV